MHNSHNSHNFAFERCVPPASTTQVGGSWNDTQESLTCSDDDDEDCHPDLRDTKPSVQLDSPIPVPPPLLQLPYNDDPWAPTTTEAQRDRLESEPVFTGNPAQEFLQREVDKRYPDYKLKGYMLLGSCRRIRPGDRWIWGSFGCFVSISTPRPELSLDLLRQKVSINKDRELIDFIRMHTITARREKVHPTEPDTYNTFFAFRSTSDNKTRLRQVTRAEAELYWSNDAVSGYSRAMKCKNIMAEDGVSTKEAVLPWSLWHYHQMNGTRPQTKAAKRKHPIPSAAMNGNGDNNPTWASTADEIAAALQTGSGRKRKAATQVTEVTAIPSVPGLEAPAQAILKRSFQSYLTHGILTHARKQKSPRKSFEDGFMKDAQYMAQFAKQHHLLEREPTAGNTFQSASVTLPLETFQAQQEVFWEEMYRTMAERKNKRVCKDGWSETKAGGFALRHCFLQNWAAASTERWQDVLHAQQQLNQ